MSESIKDVEIDEKDPEPPENWDRCHAYLKQKKRFCRQQLQKSSIYCGNHQHLEVGTTKTTKRKRIPCPVDPSHMIYEDQKEKHIPICPKSKKRKRQEDAYYFKENVNAGGNGDLFCAPVTLSPTKHDTVKWAQQLALRVLEVHQQLFQNDSNSNNPTTLTFSDIHNAIEMKDLSQQELDAGIEKGFRSHRIKAGGFRHIAQIASLIGHLRAVEALPPGIESKERKITNGVECDNQKKPHVFLEMGAGRGMFGLTASGVAGSQGLDTHLMMVERTGTRGKADKIFRNLEEDESSTKHYLKLGKVKWSRIDCDLLHVYLPDLLNKNEDLKKAKIVVIAKHLCGVGTDLALKAMEPIKNRVNVCVLATCCHGVCNWRDYVGRDFLRQKMVEGTALNFGPKEFNLMRQWCAGTVASHDKEDESVEKAPENEILLDHSVTTEPRKGEVEVSDRVNIAAIVSSLKLGCGVQGLGRACQRLIDYGRSEYLRNNIFHNQESASVNLCHYITPNITPQNAVLVGFKRNQKDD